MTEKLEGTSATYVLRRRGWRKTFGVFSRHTWRGHGSVYWEMGQENGIKGLLESLMGYGVSSVALQGEIIGPKIQGNIYGMGKPKLFVYRIRINHKNGNSVFLNPVQIRDVLTKWLNKSGKRVEAVPYLGSIVIDQETTVDSILMLAEAKSEIGDTMMEGVVFVCESDASLSFKAVSNAYLLEKGK